MTPLVRLLPVAKSADLSFLEAGMKRAATLLAAISGAILASLLLGVALALAPVGAVASTIIFDPSHLVASVHTRGQYDNAGLTTWQGQPLSPDTSRRSSRIS